MKTSITEVIDVKERFPINSASTVAIVDKVRRGKAPTPTSMHKIAKTLSGMGMLLSSAMSPASYDRLIDLYKYNIKRGI